MTRKGERQGVSPPSVLADPVPAIASRFDRTNDLTAASVCHPFIDGLCATGFASAPHAQEALAEPVAHIETQLTKHQVRDVLSRDWKEWLGGLTPNRSPV